jgi:hypothetical protein
MIVRRTFAMARRNGSTRGWEKWFAHHWRMENRGIRARDEKAKPGRRWKTARGETGRRWSFT